MSGVTAHPFDTGPPTDVTFFLRRARPPLGPADEPCGARPLCGATREAASNEGRKAGVRARPLFENSTACRKSVPSNTPCSGYLWSGLGFLWLIDIASVSSRFSAGSNSSTESLILAQDERWRRA